MQDEMLIEENYNKKASEAGLTDLLLYELTTMNETFVTERALSSKQLLETTKLVKQVNEQINQLKTLAPEVHQYLNRSVNAAASSVAAIISKQSAEAATKGAEDVIRKLEQATENAQHALRHYQRHMVTSQWKMIGVAAAITIATCCLVFWFLTPKPAVPLTGAQINYLIDGITMSRIWPQLSAKEKEHWNELAKKR
jgi:ElaB/YqjD/DUF883 family membrane-anchored ribosome-binding protein